MSQKRASAVTAVLVSAGGALALMGLSGCAGGANAAEEPAPAESPSSSAPAPAEQGDVAKIKHAASSAMASGEVTEKRLREALVSAGWQDSSIETGQNITPTGLDVDNIDAAVKSDGRCVLVDVRANRTVTVATAPVLSTESCLIGTAYKH